VKYYVNNHAQLGRINVFNHEASGGKYVPRSVHPDLGPVVIGAVHASPLVELSFKLTSETKTLARATTGPRPTAHRLVKILLNPCSVASFVVT
jgi:hypothetical protein